MLSFSIGHPSSIALDQRFVSQQLQRLTQIVLQAATKPALDQPQQRQLFSLAFEYKSHVIWKKNRGGTGYWFINWHEVIHGLAGQGRRPYLSAMLRKRPK